jgi:hypothetical protein
VPRRVSALAVRITNEPVSLTKVPRASTGT